MLFIWLKHIENDSGISEVVGIHHKPEMLTEEDKVGGVFVDSIPEPETRKGYSSILKYNSNTEELFYEYVEYKSPEDTIEELKSRVSLLQSALDDLLMGGMM